VRPALLAGQTLALLFKCSLLYSPVAQVQGLRSPLFQAETPTHTSGHKPQFETLYPSGCPYQMRQSVWGVEETLWLLKPCCRCCLPALLDRQERHLWAPRAAAPALAKYPIMLPAKLLPIHACRVCCAATAPQHSGAAQLQQRQHQPCTALES